MYIPFIDIGTLLRLDPPMKECSYKRNLTQVVCYAHRPMSGSDPGKQ